MPVVYEAPISQRYNPVSRETEDFFEIVSRRSANAKHFKGSKRRLNIFEGHTSPIHYRPDEAEGFQNIDPRPFKADAAGWEMRKSIYTARVASNIMDESTLGFSFLGSTVEATLTGLSWDTGKKIGALSSTVPIVGTRHGWNDCSLSYPNTPIAGVHLHVTPRRNSLLKEIEIESRNALGRIPTAAKYLEVWFRLNVPPGAVVRHGGKAVSPAKPVKLRKNIGIDCGAGREIGIKRAYASHSDPDVPGEDYRIPIETEIRVVSGDVYLIKHLPAEWLRRAVYPVVTDATFDGTTTSSWEDGFLYTASSAWATVIDNVEATSADYDGFLEVGARCNGSTDWRGRRIFLNCDTSSIPGGSVVGDTSYWRLYLDLYANNARLDHPDGDYLVLVEGTQANNDSLVTTDWDNLGSTVWGSTNYSTWAYDSTRDINLNAAGKAGISLTAAKTAIRMTTASTGGNLDWPSGSGPTGENRVLGIHGNEDANDPALHLVYGPPVTGSYAFIM